MLERAGIGPGSAVLDVACGTGGFLQLAQARGASRLAGVDASPGQLAVARARLPDADLHEGRMDHLPFDSAAYDLVDISLALQYADDAVQALREMARVARPGGTVSVITSSRGGARGSGVTFEALAPFRTAGSGPADPPSPARAIFTEPGALERFIAQAGLTIVEDDEVDTDWDYPDRATALRGVLSYAPGIRAVRTHGQDAVYAAVGAALAPYRTPRGGYHLPNRSRYLLLRAAS